MPRRIIRAGIFSDMDPRDFLRELLRRKGVRPARIARELKDAGRVGVNLQPSWSKWLNNPTMIPDVETMRPLAEYFDVSLDAFYRPKAAEAEMRRLDGIVHTAEVVTHVTQIPEPFDQALFDALPAQQRRDVAKMAALLVDAFTRYNDEPPTTGEKGKWAKGRGKGERQPAEGPNTHRLARAKKASR